MQARKVVFTGQSGIKCREAVMNFIKFATPFVRGKRSEPLFVNLEDEIIDVYLKSHNKRKSPAIWMDEILRLPIPELQELWERAFVKAEPLINDAIGENKDIFLNFHACFHHPETVEYFSIGRYSLVKRFDPDVFITLIDDIYDVHTRLRRKHQIFHPSNAPTKDPLDAIFQLIRILVWRANEIMMTKHFASELGKPHYVFAVKHASDTLYRLIFGEDIRFYLSHPITEIRRLIKAADIEKATDFQDEVHRFENAMTNEFISFIPTTIDELRIDSVLTENKQLKYKPKLTCRWDFERYEHPVNLLFVPPRVVQTDRLWGIQEKGDFQVDRMLELLHNFIDVQVSSRDHKLVEQSNCLAVYRPCFNGNPSGGVETEINYYEKLQNRSADKKCFIYLPLKDQHKLRERQFVKFMEKFFTLDESHEVITDFGSTDFSERLIQAADENEQIVDLLDDIIDKYSLEFKLSKRGLHKDDFLEAKDLKSTMVKAYLDACHGYLEFYKSAATRFWEDDDLTPEQFVSKIAQFLSKADEERK